ncbi:MAG: hypothetical protein U5K00_23020 [Melioribacteraceae bacterium]|nr:hypothetical protein [Melioribacteraceae bacterium]
MNYLKGLSAILILSFLLMSCGPDYEGTFSHNPEKPQAGEEITVMYDPTGTPLESTEQVDLVAYIYSVDLDDAVGVEMKKEGKGFVGSFSTFPNSRGVVVKFVDRKDYDNSDSNDKQGYLISLYDENGEVLAGSRAGLAAGYYFWGTSAGMERNGEKSIEEFNKAFADNTEIKSDYLESYFNVLLRVKPNEADSIIENELIELEKKTNLSETELGLLAKWFSKVDLADKAESYTQTTLEKFPEGEFAQITAMQEFNNAQSGDEKATALENFIEQFPESEMLDNMYNNIVYAYYQEGNYEKAYNFLKANPQTVHPVYYQRIVSKMINENADLNLAMMIAEEGVQQASLNLENPYTEKSNRETVKDWEKSRAYYLGLNQYAYGELLHKTGSLTKSINVLEEAINNTDKLYSQQELKEFYADVLIEAEEFDKALDEISSFIAEGNGSTPLRENLKTAFVAVNGSDEGFEGYLK